MNENNSIPNFFVIGAAKSGTTMLYECFTRHPDIFMSPIKEPHYFSTDIDPNRFRDDYARTLIKSASLKQYLDSNQEEEIFNAFVRERTDYLKLFKKHRSEKAIGEISNTYLFSSVAAKNIHDFNPDAKIIVQLRNPVKRAFSHYLMDVKMGFTNLSFLDAIEADFNNTNKGWGISSLLVEIGLYCQQIRRYIEEFGENRVYVSIFEEFVRDSESHLKDIYRFLGVDEEVRCGLGKANPGLMPRPGIKIINYIMNKLGLRQFSAKLLNKNQIKFVKKIFFNTNIPKISQKEYDAALGYFLKDIECLERLLNKDLTGWKSFRG